MMKANKQTISKNGCRSNSISTAKRRREYLPLIFSPLTIECDNSILTGSVIPDTPIKVDEELTVTPYENGFTTDSFEITFE